MTYKEFATRNNKNINAIPVYITSVDFTKNNVILMFANKDNQLTKYNMKEIIRSVNNGDIYIKNPDILKQIKWNGIG